MIPDWVLPVVLPGGEQEIQPGNDEMQDDQPVPSIPQPITIDPANAPAIAPTPRRFAGTRYGIGRFVQTGDTDYLKHGLGHYVRHGFGSSFTATKRLSKTVHTAASLFRTLSSSQALPSLGLLSGLAGRSLSEIRDIIIEHVRPIDGSQDAEVNRQSIAEAISDLLDDFPDIDLATLTPEQIELVVEHYITHDICHRIELDVGKNIQIKARNAALAVQRLEEMKDFISVIVHNIFMDIRRDQQHLDSSNIASRVHGIVQKVFGVFEEYIS